jgi:hypothetical protein
MPINLEHLGDSKSDLTSLEILRERYGSSRVVYDFQLASPLSHAEQYRDDSAALRRYAETAINARIAQLLSAAFMKMFHFVNGYLEALRQENPFVMTMCARGALEAYSVYSDTVRVVRDNAGSEDVGLFERVKRVDDALIKATYGTRHPFYQTTMATERLSKLREATAADAATSTAKNILTYIGRLSKTQYAEAMTDYELLSEFVHPNVGQNSVLLWPAPNPPGFARMDRASLNGLLLATLVSVRPMERSARGTRQVFEGLKPPFGTRGVVYNLPSPN